MRRRHKRGWFNIVVIALALFVAFEVGIRLITPDAVEVTLSFIPCTTPSLCTLSPNGSSLANRSGVATDSRTIAMYQALLAPPNESQSLASAYLTAWTGVGCPPGLLTNVAMLRFTWHGIPVEVASPGPGCEAEWSQVSSGGLPDPNMYILDFFGR